VITGEIAVVPTNPVTERLLLLIVVSDPIALVAAEPVTVVLAAPDTDTVPIAEVPILVAAETLAAALTVSLPKDIVATAGVVTDVDTSPKPHVVLPKPLTPHAMSIHPCQLSDPNDRVTCVSGWKDDCKISCR